MNLKVPFAEKDEAKKLGARWDAARKLWYINNDGKLAAFARWSPTPHAAVDGAVVAGPVAKPHQSAGKLVIGSAYREVVPLCACPPWQLCTQCQPLALAS